MTTVNMFEAKSTLSKLVEAVESGAETEIIIARNGKPAARLVPLEKESDWQPRRLGIAEGELGNFDYEEFQALDKEIWKDIEDSPLFPPDGKSARRKTPPK